MSSILKALRKLEEEKAAIGDGGVDISRDILRHSARKHERPIFWPVLSVVLLLLLIAAAFIFLSTEQSSVTVLPNKSNLVQPESASLPALKGVQKTELPSTAVKLTAQTPPIQTPPIITGPLKDPLPLSKPGAVQAEPAALRPDGLPYLRLTGIAYREKPTERIAIINDLPVMMGTIIEGAQLVDILKDHALLRWRGELFSLQIEADK